jgi:hypothetical protein
MSAQMSSQQSVYTRTLAQCCVYDVVLDTDYSPPLDDNFVERIAGYDGSPAGSYKLFDDFGTHVVIQVCPNVRTKSLVLSLSGRVYDIWVWRVLIVNETQCAWLDIIVYSWKQMSMGSAFGQTSTFHAEQFGDITSSSVQVPVECCGRGCSLSRCLGACFYGSLADG